MPLDRLAAAGDPRLRRILLYARGRRDPFTATEAAVELDVHRNVVRSRLDRLAEAGFLAITFERRGRRRGPGAGRPAKVYSVAPELQAIEFPDRRLVELIAVLLTKLPARGRAEALRDAGEDFGRTLAAAARLSPSRDIATGLEEVCDALGSLGFQVSVTALAGDRVELATPTCPLRPLVAKCPDASAIDQGMWAGLVERGLHGVSADRIACQTPRCLNENAACSVVLSLGLATPLSAAMVR